MARPQYRPAAELKPFALLIREGYMWRQTPPLTVSDLAARTGIGKMTIWSWINKNAKPRRDSLQVLHRVTGIPLEELLEAAGYANPIEDALGVLRRDWRDRFSPAVLDQVVLHIRGVLEEVLNTAPGETVMLPPPTFPTPATAPSERAEQSR